MNKKYLFIAIILAASALFYVFSSKRKHQMSGANTGVKSEQHRPHFHFTPEKGWMNDPNGMVFFEGEYHLFYQYYPDSTVWGPMHWGHAVSPDMVNWEHLPIAIYPDSLGYIFSGSAVVDWKNTSGFGEGKQPPLVAMFTYHNMKGEKSGRNDYETQGIAYSNDKGRTWIKYRANPVLPNPGNQRDFRDPKVVWDEARNQWVVALAVKDHAEFWTSTDLKNWSKQSEFGKEFGAHGGVWECPDLFPINISGTKNQKWVLIQNLNPGGANGGSGTQYFVGDFDGKTFSLDPLFGTSARNGNGVWLDYGRDNYATVTWSDVLDGRRLSLGWMSNWDYAQKVPTVSWRSANTIPRELVLKNTNIGLRLFANPVKELATLRTSSKTIDSVEIDGEKDLTDVLGFSPAVSEMELDLSTDGTADFGIELSNKKGEIYRVGYNSGAKHYYSDRTKAGKTDFDEKFAKITYATATSGGSKIKMHLFFDVASMELFAEDGAIQLTDIFFPTENFTNLKLYSANGKVKLTKGVFHQINSVTKTPSKDL